LYAITRRMVLDAQLALIHNDAQIPIVPIVVAFEDDLISQGRCQLIVFRSFLNDLRRPDDRAVRLAKALHVMSAIAADDIRDLRIVVAMAGEALVVVRMPGDGS
jgi:hypothetical protein